MGNYENHGYGLAGRVDGPLFDARHVLVPTSLLLGIAGEAIQNEAEQRRADGIALPPLDGVVGNAYELVATMPFDAKALGLACATAAAVTLVHAGRAVRDIAVENVIINAGLPREAAVDPAYKRFLKRAGTTAIAGLAAFGAYKTGEHLSAPVNLAADMGIMGAGAAYFGYMRRRVVGNL